MCRTRYEWTLTDFALWAAGAVTVPIYETSSADQVAVDPRGLRRHRRRASRPGRTREPSPSVRGRPAPASRTSGASTTATSTTLAASGAESPTTRARPRRRGRGRPPSPSRRSSTPPARPAGPRAASSPTATSSTWPRTPSSSSSDVVSREGASHPALPAARPRLRPLHPGALRRRGRQAGPHRRHQDPARRPRRRSSRPSSSPSRASSRRSTTRPRPRPSAGGKGNDLRQGRRDRHRVRSEATDTAARPASALRAKHAALRQARLRQAARRAWAARSSTPSPAAPRSAPRLGHFFRGIGVTILEGYGLTETTAPTSRQPARAPQDRHGRPAPAGHVGAHRRGRRDPAQGRQRLPRLPQQPRGHRPRPSATAGSTPATSASSTTTATSRSPAARRRSS